LTFADDNGAARPNASPSRNTVRSASVHAEAFKARLMKPGPATSTFSISGSARRRAAIASARSRGLALASLASTIAALVAISPWLASRGGSTTTREKSVPAGQLPSEASAAQIACTRASTSAKRWGFAGVSAMGAA